MGMGSLVLLTDVGLRGVVSPENGLLAGVVLLAATAVNIALVHEALRPIRSLERTARRIEAGDEDARAHTTLLADRRVTALVRTFNRMLDRQNQAHRHERDRAARTLRLMDAESSRSAGELYDSLAQTLAGVLLRIRLLGRSPAFEDGPGSEHDEASRMLAELRAEVLEALEEARGIARRLHPPELKELGLASALEALARAYMERTGVDVIVKAERALPTLPLDIELAVFRIAQEGLRNVVEHSRAGRTTVELGQDNRNLTLQICDDGLGFDAGEVLSGGSGLGLASIQERAAQAGGRVTIRSRPDEGTCIDLRVPLPAHEPAESAHGGPGSRIVGSAAR